MNSRVLKQLALICFGILLYHPSSSFAVSQSLTPHQALYKISLVKSHGGSQIINIDGEMFYEWEQSCDGWISHHNFNVLYEYADSRRMRVKNTFSSFESLDGEHFNFEAQKKRDGHAFEDIRGHVEDDKAVYKQPDTHELDLPDGTIFPIAHTLKILESIQKNENIFAATLFDGSDTDGPVEVNTFIGPEFDTSQIVLSNEIDQVLLDTKARKLRLAFFPLESDAAEAEYEMDLVFHDNGVISAMEIEYDQFTIEQKLIALEPVNRTCPILPNTQGHDSKIKGQG